VRRRGGGRRTRCEAQRRVRRPRQPCRQPGLRARLRPRRARAARRGRRGGRVIPPSWRYAWHNSADPRIVRAHRWADTATSLRPGVITSVPGADEGARPVIAYGGVPEGLTHVLPFLEQRRGTPGRHHRQRTRWSELTAGRPVGAADILAVGGP